MAAAKYGIRHIWEGHSFRTEGISPPGWFYMDARYVKTIHRQFGDGKIRTLPMLWLHRWLKWIVVNRIKKLRPLYYLDYDKEATKQMLAAAYGWQWYGGHHMENRTATFVNNYYLPKKFGIDLRYSEFSALVRSGHMDRADALAAIQCEKPFDDEIRLEIMTRVGFSTSDWQRIMQMEPRHYTDYETYKRTFERLRPLFYLLYKADYVPKSFYAKYACKSVADEAREQAP